MIPGGAEFAGHVIQALGWSLLHFVWQGAVIGILCWAVLRAQETSRPSTRYWTAMSGLALMAAAPLVTFFTVLDGLTVPGAIAGGATALLPGFAAGPMMDVAGTQSAAAAARHLEAVLPVAVALWLAGVIVMALRLLWDIRQINRLLNEDVNAVPARWERILAGLRACLGVRQPVRMLESCRVSVPLVIGWLRPTILIPPSALMGLTPRQLELIIAHELAHVRRADWLFNLFQVLVETVLFYHPAVRLLSRRIRAEREQCCDDIVVEATGDTLTYARALTEVEGLRAALTARMAIGASDGQLAGRVTRLIAPPRPQRGFVHWAPVALLVSSAVITAGSIDRRETAPTAAERGDAPVLAGGVGSLGPSAADARVRYPAVPASAAETPSGTPAATVRVEPTRKDGSAGTAEGVLTEVEPAVTAAAATLSGPSADEVLPEPEMTDDTPVMEPGPASPAGASRVAASVTVASLPPISPTGLADRGSLGQERTPVSSGSFDFRSRPDQSAAQTQAAEISPASGLGDGDGDGDGESGASGSLPGAGQPVVNEDALSAGRASAPIEEVPVYEGGTLVRGKAPDFPRRARTRAEGGRVVVAYTIDQRGRIRDLEIVESSGRDFSQAVKRALKGWRFDPYTRDGQVVERRVARTFDFNLEAGGPALEEDSRCGNATASRLCRRYASAGDPEATPPDPKPADDCLVTGSRICGRHAAGQHVVVVYEAD